MRLNAEKFGMMIVMKKDAVANTLLKMAKTNAEWEEELTWSTLVMPSLLLVSWKMLNSNETSIQRDENESTKFKLYIFKRFILKQY